MYDTDLLLHFHGPPAMQWVNQYFRFGNGRDARGLLFSEGEEWSQQRKFAMRGNRNNLMPLNYSLSIGVMQFICISRN